MISDYLDTIKRMIKFRRLTIRKVAQKLGYSYFTVYKLLDGKSTMNTAKLYDLAEILECDVFITFIPKSGWYDINPRELTDYYVTKSATEIGLVIDGVPQNQRGDSGEDTDQ